MRLDVVRLLTVSVAAATVLTAAWTLSLVDGDVGLGRTLDFLDGESPLYAAALVWVLVAPLPVLLGAVFAREARLPWVVLCAVHLAALVTVTYRLEYLLDDLARIVVAGVAVLGVASIAAVVTLRGERYA
ncbi:MAG: hypothetical protein CMH83_10595 [Nocardioides sp.]|nr:hypothetical protein [Nocardioides sp.]